MNMKIGVKEQLWRKFVPRIVARLSALGVGRSAVLWLLLERISPALAGAVALTADAELIDWVWDGGEPGVEDVVDIVCQLIRQAACPVGGDRYLVVASRLSALEGDESDMSWDHVEATTVQRQVISQAIVEGNRWRLLRNNDGAQAIRDLLQRSAPSEVAPITVVQVNVIGAAAGAQLRRLGWQG